MNSIGIRRSLVFYSILTAIIIASMSLPNLAFIVYFLIVAIPILLKNREGKFKWGTSWRFGFLFGFILISLIFLFELGLGLIELENLNPDAFYILISYVVFEMLVSAGEELSFRGYIFPNLADSLGIRGAIIVTSILFAGLHIPSIQALGIEPFNALIMLVTVSLAGILLSLLYLVDGLKMSGGFHFSWNFFQYHVFSLRSGFGIFGLTAAKPALTGGIAGPEAGIIGLVVLLLGIFILWVLFPGLRKE